MRTLALCTVLVVPGCATAPSKPTVPPCVTIWRHATRQRHESYARGGVEVGSLERTVQGLPEAEKQVARAEAKAKAWPLLFVGQAALGVGGLVEAWSSHRAGRIAGGVLVAAGVALDATGIASLVSARRDRRRAVARYNDWAAVHGCPAVQVDPDLM